MTFEKLKRLRLMNIISYSLLLIVSIWLAFFPVSGHSNVDLFKERNSLFPLTDRMAIINVIVIIGLGLYTKFQSGNIRFRENISAKCLLCLGWTFMALNILTVLQMISFQLRWSKFTYILTILIFFLLMIINSDVSDDEDVMDEKFYVRNPFSLYLGFNLFTLCAMTVFIFKNTFAGETAIILILSLLYILAVVLGMRNRNLGILIMLILINIANYPQSSGVLRILLTVSSAVMAVMIYVIYKINREAEKRRKPLLKSRARP